MPVFIRIFSGLSSIAAIPHGVSKVSFFSLTFFPCYDMLRNSRLGSPTDWVQFAPISVYYWPILIRRSESDRDLFYLRISKESHSLSRATFVVLREWSAPIRSFIHNREYNRIVNICSQFSIVLNSSGLKQHLDKAEDILAQELLRKATEIADGEVPFYISDEEFSQVTNLVQRYSFCFFITLTHSTNMVWPITSRMRQKQPC